MSDTDPAAEAVLIAGLREQPVWRKLRMIGELNRAAEELARAGICRRYPQASPREVKLRLAALRFDRETMIRAFDWDPEVHGY